MSYNPPEIAAEAKAIAKRFFEHAQTVAESRNYDYAIELYLQGLQKDPQAIETGLTPLREVAFRRKAAGGKKPGIIETMKRASAGKKNAYAAVLNHVYLFAKDPLNVKNAENLVESADRAELPETLHWALGACFELSQPETKLNIDRILKIKRLYEKLGDYYDTMDRPNLAVECYEKGVNAMEIAIMSGQGKGYDLAGEQRDLAGKLTILRGKYERAEGFRESIDQAEAQKELLDRDRVVKSDDVLEKMIAKARAELEESPEIAGKVTALADLLIERDRSEDQAEAIDVLEKSCERTGQYSHKVRADDIRIRQMKADVKTLSSQLKAQDTPSDDLKRQLAHAEQACRDFELNSYKDRVEHYPTDLRLKFEYGRRLYAAKRYEHAIPVFQEAVRDPKSAVRARFYIGTCFYRKDWHTQAVDVLNQAIASYEIEGDDLSKEMHYILGRAYEKMKQTDNAMKAYSTLIQWDYNYRDVRRRIDRLQ